MKAFRAAIRIRYVLFGLGLALLSFFLSLEVIDYWRANQIEIVEATYGANCKNFAATPPIVNRAVPGNATAAVLAACNHKEGCAFRVDVDQLGDPAGRCPKDFTIRWRCGSAKDVHQKSLPPEANGKTIVIWCPAALN
jgi:hypothetical protein